ncbi:MAG TPA: hypothetical protein VFT74_20055, partial [Isosphaeraceae bacterium]|nr:hypothetical protein [Isosphaeraceae bacterium]
GPQEVPGESQARGWVERTIGRWQGRLDRSEGWFARLARRVRRNLERFVGRDEPLLRGLRKTDSVVIHHPQSWTQDQASTAWSAYIRQRKRHHAIWLVVNAVLGVPLVALAVLPGPNLVGYWFAYRVACHTLALLGIQKALGRRFEVWFRPDPTLEDALENLGPEHLAKVAHACGLRGLDVFLLDGLPHRPVEPRRHLTDDPARSLQDRGHEGPVSDPSTTRSNRSPGDGREVGRCGS